MGYSFSQISIYLRCPALYKLLYIDHMVPVEPPQLALEFGTAIHAGINAILEGGGGIPVFTSYWASVSSLPFAKARQSHAELRAMGETFLERFKKLHLPHYAFVKGEDRLYSQLPSGIKIEGTLDALVMYKKKLTLMDFKTSSTRYPDEKPAISMQLALYVYLVEQNMPVTIEQVAYTVFIKGREPSIQVQVLDLDREWLHHMIENIDHICNDMQSRKTFPRNYETALQYGRKCPACFPGEYSLTPRIKPSIIVSGGI